MITFLLLLASYGVCFTLINKAKFLRKIAFFEKMLECVFCTGFHAGWMTYLLISFSLLSTRFPLDWAELVATAFASASFCYTLDTIIIYLEYKTAKLKQVDSQQQGKNLFS